MTTTKYASPLAASQAKLALARSAALGARIARDRAIAAQLTAAGSLDQWVEERPTLAKLPDRPTYRGVDGLAVSGDGQPFMIEDRQANRPDLLCPPPPSAEVLADLEAVLTKAERREKTAQKAEVKARQEWTPPENTGFVVAKPGRIAGTRYAVGDAFEPGTVEPRKFQQFLRTGLIRHG